MSYGINAVLPAMMERTCHAGKGGATVAMRSELLDLCQPAAGNRHTLQYTTA